MVFYWLSVCKVLKTDLVWDIIADHDRHVSASRAPSPILQGFGGHTDVIDVKGIVLSLVLINWWLHNLVIFSFSNSIHVFLLAYMVVIMLQKLFIWTRKLKNLTIFLLKGAEIHRLDFGILSEISMFVMVLPFFLRVIKRLGTTPFDDDFLVHWGFVHIRTLFFAWNRWLRGFYRLLIVNVCNWIPI